MTQLDTNGSREYGVIFSGGGALAAWEVGCYQAIVSHHQGTEPSIVTGASAGAINAAAIASGYSTNELRNVWASLTTSDVLETSLRGQLVRLICTGFLLSVRHLSLVDGVRELAARTNALFDTAQLRRTLHDLLNPRWQQFSQHAIPFATPLTNLSSGEKLIFYTGQPNTTATSGTWQPIRTFNDLVSALLGTCALPGIFPPIDHPNTGDPLFDGGILRNQPLGPALDYGAKRLYVLTPTRPTPNPCRNIKEIFDALISTWVGQSYQWQKQLADTLNIGVPATDKIQLTLIEPEHDLKQRFNATLLSLCPSTSKRLIDDGEERASYLLSP